MSDLLCLDLQNKVEEGWLRGSYDIPIQKQPIMWKCSRFLGVCLAKKQIETIWLLQHFDKTPIRMWAVCSD